MSIDNVIGHENIRKYFKESIKSGTLAHAHLIVGEDGIGKSLIAREAAVELLGKSELKQYVDILEFKSYKNKKSLGVDEVRDIIEEVSKKPFEADKKIIIIYEGEKITVQAQNALLKTIEEPPKGVFIFVICENLEMILDTIKSRCQIHKLNKLSSEEVSVYLNKKYPRLKKEEFSTILTFCDGIPGRAEAFMENEEFKQIRNIAAKLLIDINSMKDSQVFIYENMLIKYKNLWEELLAVLLSYIRDIMIYKDTGNDLIIINKDKIKEIIEAASLFSYNKLNSIIDIINDARENFKSNANTALTYDVMLLKMLEA